MNSQSISTKNSDLYLRNSPSQFWLCVQNLPCEIWQEAVLNAVYMLELDPRLQEISEILKHSLGEERFGEAHWHLSMYKRIYYHLKPAIPRWLIKIMRQIYSRPEKLHNHPHWPMDKRFVRFQWEVLRQVMLLTNVDSIQYRALWPDEKKFALVLTHDIETAAGQAFAARIADLEQSLGFVSSFNFVLERYSLDIGLMNDLQKRGFEVGCHGLKHDGKLYSSKNVFEKRSVRINALMQDYGMVGFRSPLTHRNPYWMQALNIEYDLSFFDTDPFEPVAGGSMTIWPFMLGHFVELPYTLVQDHSLTTIMNENTPGVWLKKVDFLCRYHGMALLNSHPDYLLESRTLRVYTEFLQTLQNRADYWHALPKDVAWWWRRRLLGDSTSVSVATLAEMEYMGVS